MARVVVTTRRIDLCSAAVSIGIHALIAAALFLGFQRFAPVQPAGTPPMAIEILPVPSAPPMARDTAPTPTPPTPVEIAKTTDEVPTVIHNQPDAPVLVSRRDTPTPDKPKSEPTPPKSPDTQAAQPPAAPSAPAPPKAVAAAPTQGASASTALSAEQSWQSRVLAQLEKKKRYPGPALRAGQQDVVSVRIRVDRNGHVLSAAIAKSQRFAMLDAAVLDAVRRSQPFPAPPDSVPGNSVDFVVDIDFFIGRR